MGTEPFSLVRIRRWFAVESPIWLRAGFVLIVAAACACVGRGSEDGWSDTLLIAGLLLAALASPLLGVVGLIAGSQMSPLRVVTGTMTDLNFTVLYLPALIGIWLFDVAERRPLRFFSFPTTLPLLALCGVAVLSFGVGNLGWFGCGRTAPLAAQLGGLAVFFLSAGAFLVVADGVRSVSSLRTVTWVFLGLAGLHIGGRILPALGQYTRLIFMEGIDGSLFWTWVVALAFGQAACNRHLGWSRWLAWLALAIVAFEFVFDQSRGWLSGWLPPLAAAAVVVLAAVPRLGAVLALVAAVVGAVAAKPIFGALMIGDNAYSLSTRLDAWRILAQIIAANPILGLGPSNYYHCAPLFPIRGYHVNFSSHNNYVDIVAQTGVVGLVFFAWFIWRLGRLAWGMRRRVPAGFAEGYVYGAIGGLGGTLVAGMLGDWVLPFVYNVTLMGMRASVVGWVFLGGLVAIDRIAADEERVE